MQKIFLSANPNSFSHKIQHLCPAYVSRKNKCTIARSTMYNKPVIGSDKTSLPEIISLYNCAKGVIDTVDLMLICYSGKHETNWWPMAVFPNIIFRYFCLYSIHWRMSRLAAEAKTHQTKMIFAWAGHYFSPCLYEQAKPSSKK